MFKPIIRLLSFFSKEVNEIRRQPKLVLSLLLGPFLILLLFGVGYQGERPRLRTVLVLPPQGLGLVNLDDLKRAIDANFELLKTTADANEAAAMLQSGEAEVVETLPADIEQVLASGKQATVTFTYNEINPLNEQWIQYLAYAQVNEINRAVQTKAVQQLQGEVQRAGVQTTYPPEVLVSPVRFEYSNVRGKALDFMTYYAPGVLALIIQHIAVTLGALSLVRERLLGAIELFRVAPVSINQLLLGKYLGFTLFIGIILAALVALLVFTPLAVPFAGDVTTFVAFSLLFTLASLGIGFVISAWASSDSQAVQMSMLVLLMSIFFSGFFLPLENFASPVREIGYALPLTHAISGYQALMLRGHSPSQFAWEVMGIIVVAAFLVVSMLARWRFRQLA
ncbi:MAG TPA: ABC transporter permease [Kouleothrix sp.]|uniref:ABC transporter permease n=1 Tax=Kouleothrix sp. TaxID=2779161 RepID=UPI002B9DE7FF|nr:ABC transporter permease [Kouleothrix sp.]HRC76150.1 ABC transporter permease [Kouleothrix sp.]